MYQVKIREDFGGMSKYKVLIIGAGNIAALFDTPQSNKILTYAHAFSSNFAFNLKGFYDTDYKKSYAASEIWDCKAFKELDDAMKDINVVCCCVPDEYHFDILKKIADYPVKLVVAEKPLAKTVKEAEYIEYLYKSRNISLEVNYSRRFIEEFQALKQNIKDYGNFIKGTGYYGKGIIHNGSHMVDLLTYLLGEISEIEKTDRFIKDFTESDSSCDAVLHINNGIFNMTAIDSRIATIFEMDLFFEKARVRVLDGGNIIEIYKIKESEEYKGYYNYVLSEVLKVDYSGAMQGLVNNIKDFLGGNDKLQCTLEDGKRVIKTCLAIGGGN